MKVIADTGPLVALFDAGDEFHAWAMASLGGIREPLLTSEAVLGEALFLLAPLKKSRAAFLEFWMEGGLIVSFNAEAQKSALAAMMKKYQDLPMSLADASIVRMSELFTDAPVWSLDRHFTIYRRLGRKSIPLLDWPRG